MSQYPRGLDIMKHVEKEQLGVPAGYEALRLLRPELSVGSCIEASTLRDEMLRYRPPISTSRPLDIFRAVQVEIAKYDRLTSAFPDLALQEPDKCMIVLRCLDQEVKRYILLHSKIDSLVQLEQAIRFYDANLKILQFSEKPGKGPRNDERANPMQFKGGW